MKNENKIKMLNSLIIINNDRIEGYETASEETEEKDLKDLFSQSISTSQKCNQELIVEVYRLGGVVAEDTVVRGKFFRVWMDVKAALINNDREAIFGACEYGENKTQDAYAKVLEKNLENIFDHLSIEQQIMLITQKSKLKSDRVSITSLRNVMEEV